MTSAHDQAPPATPAGLEVCPPHPKSAYDGRQGNMLMEAALEYAKLGWPVFPCHPSTKRPLVGPDLTPDGRPIDGTGGVKKATINPATIQAWWEKWPKAMIGAATGSPSGVFVVDFDGGMDETTGEIIEAARLVAELEAAIGEKLLPTWRAATPRGGLHFYFRYPDDRRIGNRTGLLGKHSRIDVRGDGGYVILPPSIRADGKAYDWCTGLVR